MTATTTTTMTMETTSNLMENRGMVSSSPRPMTTTAGRALLEECRGQETAAERVVGALSAAERGTPMVALFLFCV